MADLDYRPSAAVIRHVLSGRQSLLSAASWAAIERRGLGFSDDDGSRVSRRWTADGRDWLGMLKDEDRARVQAARDAQGAVTVPRWALEEVVRVCHWSGSRGGALGVLMRALEVKDG